ncbi:hypothetical protein [Haloarcula sebkhae]|nr:hypothetical protein [Haloarcula sebkhae]
MADENTDPQGGSGKLQKRGEELPGRKEATLSELCNPTFMRKYTDFESLEEFASESPWSMESKADFERIPDDPLAEYVNEHTIFADGNEMMRRSAQEVLAERLGL